MAARQSEVVTKALKLVDSGLTPYAAAKKLKIAFSTIYRAIERREHERKTELQEIKRERRELDKREAELLETK